MPLPTDSGSWASAEQGSESGGQRFPQFIKKIDYYQGGTSSVAFTDRRPPGYWLPMLTHDDPLDQVTPRVERSIAEEVSSFLHCIFVDGCLMLSSGLTLWLRKMHSANRLSLETEPSRRSNRTVSSSSKTSVSARRQLPRRRSPATPSQRVQKSPSTRRKPPTTSSKPRRRSTKDDNLQDDEPNPIWTASATKMLNDRPSLVFSYNLGVEDRYYILYCPTETCDFLFRTHPFHDNLAFNHFRECGVDFKDEADIVRRYGRLLLSHRASPHTSVRQGWIDDYNKKVSASREAQQVAESGSSTSLPVIVESSPNLPEDPPVDVEMVVG
ncbi:hypothetical protein CH35J_007308 [Colletotrichum higginsianum]|uniref:Uncharacterized protein n=1 Tax=Colletotrichum higginsianum TaxID=80884 RepID=A0A4T0VXC6_9PEZI|nr:hypothetical protein CH35J_007308 [Colletotrichum higginsianum]